jgi:hypothetical protein
MGAGRAVRVATVPKDPVFERFHGLRKRLAQKKQSHATAGHVCTRACRRF